MKREENVKGDSEKMKKTIARLLAIMLVVTLLSGLMAGCENLGKPKQKTFDMFIAMPGTELNEGNKAQEEIAKITGVKVKETWLVEQTAEEAIGVMVAAKDYPDFIEASDGYQIMVDAGALIPIDKYWDKYPNIKNYLSEEEWNMCRKADGHIYAIPQFGIVNEKDVSPIHNDEAWWIQTRVLKWANYPKIETMDEFFKLLEDYYAANPKHVDGTDIIPYTILTEDWRYFCLENPPLFLAGSPNDGSVIVDPATRKVVDYNTTPVAKQYFAKLNEEYKKGIVDPESFTQSYDEYIAKISTGRVLGFVDQFWDWGYTAQDAIKNAGLNDCTYVPLGIVAEKGIEEHYHNEPVLDVSGGLSITTSCKDIDGAMKFISDLLTKEVQTLRFWGIKDVDYQVGADGLFFRTEDMRAKAIDANYKADNLCPYAYFPQYQGMNLDGKNAWRPDNQPSEFFEDLLPEVKECLEAYGAKTYVEMLNPSKPNEPWFPMWSFSNDLTTETPGGLAWNKMTEVKHEYLPRVVVAEDFEAEWTEYLKIYNERADINAFLTEMQAEVDRRIAVAEGK
jgi:putative aldouronate transport system substrate-binding protein